MVIAGFMAARVCGSCLIMPQWTGSRERGRGREREEGETGTMGRAGL